MSRAILITQLKSLDLWTQSWHLVRKACQCTLKIIWETATIRSTPRRYPHWHKIVHQPKTSSLMDRTWYMICFDQSTSRDAGENVTSGISVHFSFYRMTRKYTLFYTQYLFRKCRNEQLRLCIYVISTCSQMPPCFLPKRRLTASHTTVLRFPLDNPVI